MNKMQKIALIGLASAFVVGFTYWIQETQITVLPQQICDLDDANLILLKDPEAKCENQ